MNNVLSFVDTSIFPPRYDFISCQVPCHRRDGPDGGEGSLRGAAEAAGDDEQRGDEARPEADLHDVRHAVAGAQDPGPRQEEEADDLRPEAHRANGDGRRQGQAEDRGHHSEGFHQYHY